MRLGETCCGALLHKRAGCTAKMAKVAPGHGLSLQVVDSFEFFTASFVIVLLRDRMDAACEHISRYFFTKLSTIFVG